MVLSLSIPGLRRTETTVMATTTTTAAAAAGGSRYGNDKLNNDAGNEYGNGNDVHSSMSEIQTSINRKTKKKPSSTTPSSPSTPSTTLTEALRNNPFGITSHSRPQTITAEGTKAMSASAVIADTNLRTKSRQEEERRRELQELNDALVTLAELFPDVRIEVFRELLIRFDGNSRLKVCVEQLLRYKNEWVKGRWNVLTSSQSASSSDSDLTAGTARHATLTATDGCWVGTVVPHEEMFRSEDYKAAVRMALSKEFNGLSRSALNAVLAEVNYSYSRARPILRDLSRKGWRATFSNLIPSSFKRKKAKDEHPMLGWQRSPMGAEDEPIPYLKRTGCEELDGELRMALVEPLLSLRRQSQQSVDFQLAESLNESEAKAVNALYECACCLADVTFEQISTCSSSAHVICYSCIRRTLQEALFGQGWAKSINPGKSTLQCIAPVTHGSCDGDLDPHIVKTAVHADPAGAGAGAETYTKFEGRLASEALLKSQLKLIRCAFCDYAEVDPIYHPQHGGIIWRFRRHGNLLSTILLIPVFLDLILPLLILLPIILVLLVLIPHDQFPIKAVFNASMRNLCLKTRTRRFRCANPSCKRDSCMNCQKEWRDPHVCHEPLLQSLRTAVEAARTAAIKRTCPCCGLSFVKSTGCNKLDCICGYSMCYLCRKALGPPPSKWFRNNNNDKNKTKTNIIPFFGRYQLQNRNDHDFEDDEEEQEDRGGEGYKHFCEHFRINPGTRCTECNKCDLYLAEDEEAVARQAGEKAEQEWRLRAQKESLLLQHRQQQQQSQMNTVITNTDQRRSSAVSPSMISSTANPNPIVASRSNSIQIPTLSDTVPLAWSWTFDPQSEFAYLDNVGLGGHRGGKSWRRLRWRYWLNDVWQDGRWRWEGQALVDWIVERAIVIVDQ